jgi:membrane-associated phospholipid phosphatase
MRKLAHSLLRLRPEEFLAVAFFVPSSLITLSAYSYFIEAGQRVPVRIRDGVTRLAVTAVVMIAFRWFVRRKPLWREFGWVRDVAPFLFCIAIYTNLHDTIHFVNPHDVHDTLIRLDQAIFGVQPCVWAQKFYRPWLTEVFSFAYMNYFLIAVSVTGWLLIEGRRPQMREALWGTVLCFYFGYVLYILFPAAPPRFTLADQLTRDFNGGWLTAAQNMVVDINPTSSRAAFPSLHCAVTLISLLYAFKFRKLLFGLLLLPAVLLVLATIYLRHHYVVDILAGFALAVWTYHVAPHVDRAWNRLRESAVTQPIAWGSTDPKVSDDRPAPA